jgi:putative membrane protein
MKKLSFLIMLSITMVTYYACTNTDNKEGMSNNTSDDATTANQDATNSDVNNSTAVSSSEQSDDSQFMMKAASGGMMEVELSNLAQQKSKDTWVKKFAAMIVRDHTKANNDLKALAASKNITLPATMGEDHQKHMDDMREKTGADFDEDYIDMMVRDHKDDVDMFEKEANNGNDADIKAFASTTLPVLRMHLDSAQSIADMMKDHMNMDHNDHTNDNDKDKK